MSDKKKQYLKVSTELPARRSDGDWIAKRGTPYGEAVLQAAGKGCYAFAEEGRYFTARTATLGTGQASQTGGAGVVTASLFLRNSSSRNSAYLDFFRSVVSATTSPTSGRYAIYSWPPNADSPATTHVNLTTRAAVNVNADSSIGPQLIVGVAAGCGNADVTSTTKIAWGVFRTVKPQIGDQYVLDFGGECRVGGNILEGTAQAGIIVNTAPVIIGPQYCAAIILYTLASTFSFEWELGWWER